MSSNSKNLNDRTASNNNSSNKNNKIIKRLKDENLTLLEELQTLREQLADMKLREKQSAIANNQTTNAQQ